MARSVEYSEFAKDIWNELEELYGKADVARVYELNKDLTHMSQGSLDISCFIRESSEELFFLWS